MEDSGSELIQIHSSIKEITNRLCAVEAAAAHDRESFQELRGHADGLRESVNRAITRLMPKVEALLTQQEAETTEVQEAEAVFSEAGGAEVGASLLEAAASGDAATVLRLLEAGSDTRRRATDGATPLHLASAGGHTRCVALLVGFGAPVEATARRQQSPLHVAAAAGRQGAVRRLLAVGARVDVRDADGNTPLAVAAREGHEGVVSVMLEHGHMESLLCARDCRGDTPLLIAAKLGHWRLAETLARFGVALDEQDSAGNSALVYATAAEKSHLVQLLLQNGASYYKYIRKESSPLVLAAEQGQIQILRDILNHSCGAGNDELSEALSRARDIDIVWTFEDARPGILHGDIGQSAMRRSAQNGFLNSMVMLLDAGVDINAVKTTNGCAALRFAAGHGKTNCVRILVERGADVNIKDNNGFTPLHCAAKYGHLGAVRVLLDAGASKTAQSIAGLTPYDVTESNDIRQLLTTS